MTGGSWCPAAVCKSLMIGTECCHLRIGRLRGLFLTNGIGDRVISYSPEETILLVTLAGVEERQDDSMTETFSSSRSESEQFLISLEGE